MNKLRAASILTLAVAAAAVGELCLYASLGKRGDRRCAVAAPPPAAAQTILYYRDPSGAPFWSAMPKADAQGSAYLPVYDDAEPKFDPPRLVTLAPLTPLKAAQGERKILYYRNPMGLPDISPVPKKDSIGDELHRRLRRRRTDRRQDHQSKP